MLNWSVKILTGRRCDFIVELVHGFSGYSAVHEFVDCDIIFALQHIGI